MRRVWIVVVSAAVFVALVLPATVARADGKGSHEWYISGPPFGPNVAEAVNGHRIELEGSGAFFVGDRRTTIAGGGPYRLLDRNGKELARGLWEAGGEARYQDHGELMPLSVIDRYRRGVLVAGVEFGKLGTGRMTIYCAAGDEETEGFRLRLGPRTFSEIVTGSTIIRHNDRTGVPGPL